VQWGPKQGPDDRVDHGKYQPRRSGVLHDRLTWGHRLRHSCCLLWDCHSAPFVRRIDFPDILRGASPTNNPNNVGFARHERAATLETMTTAWERARCRDRLQALADSSLSSVELRLEAIGILKRTIGFDRWCWPLADPAAALHLTGIGELDNWQALPRMILLEQTGDPFNAMPVLARSRRVGSILSAATGGDLARSARWDQGMRPFGIGDELRVALVDDRGMWGFIDAMRDRGDPPFEPEDVELLEQLAPVLAGALRRRSIQHPGALEGLAPAGAGVLILNEDLEIRSWTPAARAWLDALVPPGESGAEAIIYGVAGRLLALRRGIAAHPGDFVRARAFSGHWAVVESAQLLGADIGSIAVSIRPAAPIDLMDLICAAYELTARERELVTLLMAGLDTTMLTKMLVISHHTVQDHFKSIFAKVDVRSRRELVAKLTTGTVAGSNSS
jgi:DNA-binding CsgD family transcriptional regulator